jgi:polyribonucleotide nucleotidyltransferase
MKRDGRPGNHETLASRLIDRPLRPLLPATWQHETQLLLWVLSYDGGHPPMPHAITAAAAALLVSDVPFPRAVAGVQVARVDGAFVINPSTSQLEHSDIDLTMAGTAGAVMMIEGFGDFLPEADMIAAIEAGQAAIAEICTQLQVRCLSCDCCH